MPVMWSAQYYNMRISNSYDESEHGQRQTSGEGFSSGKSYRKPLRTDSDVIGADGTIIGRML